MSPPYWWQVRVLLIVAGASSLPLILHLVTHPALLRRRLRSGPLAEREPVQRVIALLLQISIFAVAAMSALDHDSSWSHVPVLAVVLGDLFVSGGLLLLWQVFRANAYAAATVTVESNQPVISSGPYALVRHPMYSALLLIFLGVPPGLGSWWGLVFVLPLLGTLIWRLRNEERYLSKHLPGYQAYCGQVTHRLIPRVW